MSLGSALNARHARSHARSATPALPHARLCWRHSILKHTHAEAMSLPRGGEAGAPADKGLLVVAEGSMAQDGYEGCGCHTRRGRIARTFHVHPQRRHYPPEQHEIHACVKTGIKPSAVERGKQRARSGTTEWRRAT